MAKRYNRVGLLCVRQKICKKSKIVHLGKSKHPIHFHVKFNLFLLIWFELEFRGKYVDGTRNCVLIKQYRRAPGQQLDGLRSKRFMNAVQTHLYCFGN